MEYTFKIRKTYNFYGSPQTIRHFEVESQFFKAKIHSYGEQGYDIPNIVCKSKCNEYFKSLNAFMREFYSGRLEQKFRNLHRDDVIEICLSC